MIFFFVFPPISPFCLLPVGPVSTERWTLIVLSHIMRMMRMVLMMILVMMEIVVIFMMMMK